MPPVIPRATYRLQFHKHFGFDRATELAPYLARLGVSHLYASSYLKARPGSTHGYDIVDHDALNPELGDEASFDRMNEALARNGLSQVLDFVPNHMGVGGADNPLWLDMLECWIGRACQVVSKERILDRPEEWSRLVRPVERAEYVVVAPTPTAVRPRANDDVIVGRRTLSFDAAVHPPRPVNVLGIIEAADREDRRLHVVQVRAHVARLPISVVRRVREDRLPERSRRRIENGARPRAEWLEAEVVLIDGGMPIENG